MDNTQSTINWAIGTVQADKARKFQSKTEPSVQLITSPKVQPTLKRDPRKPLLLELAISATQEYAAGTEIELTAEHKALPIRIIDESVANVIISQPAVMGMVIDIMVRRRPKVEHRGEDRGALSIATSGTIEAETNKQTYELVE